MRPGSHKVTQGEPKEFHRAAGSARPGPPAQVAQMVKPLKSMDFDPAR
jgi:hypothetical protein